MQTRSQSKRPNVLVQPVEKTKKFVELEVNIDFDEASRLWKSNKKKMANCCYKYVCGYELKNGEFCKNNSCKTSQYCSKHK